MGHWKKIVAAYKAMRAGAADGSDAEALWTAFQTAVVESKDQPPLHLKLLLERLEHYRQDRPREEIVIFDHGCGGALTLFYIAVLGYTNFWGVDIGGDFSALNAIAQQRFGHREARLSVFDGRKIARPDASVDVVFSQQVVEHVDAQSLDTYYAEEGRILKPRGIAIHYAPHRLVPYDSHTKTWLIHYLPGPLYRAAAQLLGSPVPDHLHLRWPWVHTGLLRHHIGSVEDLSAARFGETPDAESYDGSIRMRRLVGGLMTMPVLGALMRRILAKLVMLETVSMKG